jgi:hypothetical protein
VSLDRNRSVKIVLWRPASVKTIATHLARSGLQPGDRRHLGRRCLDTCSLFARDAAP